MSGHYRPLTCCDLDCSIVNGCRIGGYQCERCGRWFCCEDIGDDGICVDCEEAAAEENEEGDEE